MTDTEHLAQCTQALVECSDGSVRVATDYPCICERLTEVLSAAREAVATAPVATGGYATKQADLAAIDALIAVRR